MNFGQNKSLTGTAKTWSSGKGFSLVIGHMWRRVTESMKEVCFPTRCLVCGSFYRNKRLENRSLKTFIRILSRWEQCLFSSEGTVQQNIFTKEHVKTCLGADAKLFVTLMSPFICSNCSGTYMAVESPICSTCGNLFESRQGEDHHCGACINAPKKFKMARSVGVYDKVLKAAIHCLKYKEKTQLARPLSVFLFMAFCRYWNKDNIDLTVPVPLHKKKLKVRGFNPSYLLVREWAHIVQTRYRVLPAIPVDRNVLMRRKWTVPQTGLGRKERLKNIKNAFSVIDSKKVKGKKILLVDDVYTTGATVNECAKVLMRAGAASVDVLTLARAM